MGMDSGKLSRRQKQPGHDRTFKESEENFEAALRELVDSDEFEVQGKPGDLRRMLGGEYGIVPEAVLRHTSSARAMYFEVKKQGDRGNADERASKHHTVEFYRTLRKVTGFQYHAFCTVFCESLATNSRYTSKHPFFFQVGKYFLWVDYKLAPLREFLEMSVLPLLRGEKTEAEL